MSWSCVEAPWSLQEGNEQAAVQGDLPLKSKAPMSRVNCLQLTDGLQDPGNLSVCPSAQPRTGAERMQSGLVCPCQLCCLCRRAVRLCCLMAGSRQVSSRVPFPARCLHRTGQPVCGSAWPWEAAGSRLQLPSGPAQPRQCLAPQPQSLVRKKLKATQFWLISLCRPLTPPVTNPFIIALF